jgi:ribosomal protein L9
MSKENNQSSGSFSGLNISTLEKDLGMIIPGTGESSGKENIGSEEEPEKKTKSNLDLGFFSNKMQIPDTKEEIELAQGKIKETGGTESNEGKDTQSQGKGGEDVIIKEDSPLYLHAATLHEEGILPTLDLESLKGKPFKEGMQLLKDAQKKYFDEGREAYQNSLTDRQKEFLQMIENGIPEEQVENQFKLEDAYSKITDQVLSDDEELQKQIITQEFRLKGLSDTKVQAFLKSSETDGRLFEDAKESRDNINAYIAQQKKESLDAAKNAQVEVDKKEVELQKEIKTTIEKIDEILPGIKVSAVEKTKLYEYMTKPVEEKVVAGKKVAIDLINQKRMENKVLFDLKLKYFIHLGLFNEDNKTDLTKIMKKVTSSNADKLASKLKEEPNGPDGKGIKFEKEENKNKPTKIIFPSFSL